MSNTIVALKEKRANVWSQMTAIMDRATDGRLSAEDSAAYEAAEADFDQLEADAARLEAHELKNKQLSAVDRTGVVAPGGLTEDQTPKDQAYAAAFTRYMRGGMGSLEVSERQTLQNVGFEQFKNAAGTATGAAGGYTIPPAFRNKIVEQMNFIAAMRQLAEVITTDSGANLPWPTVDDTANEGAILAENSQVTEQDVTFGTNSLDAYMYTSKLVRVSFQLLQDSGFDLEGWLGRTLGTRIGRVQNRHFTVGTGSSQPDGAVTSALVGKTGAAAQLTTIIYNDLIDLIDSLDPAYLGGGNNRFMMSQAARKALRKLVDSQNRPLWEPSIQVGVPDSLLGYGVVLNNYVPVPAASAKSLLFGDFREAYVIRDVAGFQLLRLEERYADYLQVGFLGFQRSDGTMQNTSAVKAFQHAAS
jgi:HK97 family phage major capsid protein